MLQNLDVFLRLLAGLACGGVIGLNRDLHHKPAGFRTFGLVGLGSALAVLVIVQTGGSTVPDTEATSRVIQGVLTGIGFLGAGVILHRVSEGRVAGLTTAAAVWLTAGLGVAAGAGQFTMVWWGLALAMAALLIGGRIERLVERVLGRTEGEELPP
jgi:putative Mg2+ transporter-C (MgtC) family protein